MATLKEIREKLKEQENRSSNAAIGDSAIYPFWNMKENESSLIRFLPDGNESNDFFWVERLMIKLPFSGIKGQTESRPVQVKVPCMEMYGENCPILSDVRGWFKDPTLEDMGRKYWKKRSYVFQGFVIDNPLKDDENPENPIRRFIIGPQIFRIIKQSILDPDMEELPTDYIHGLDFRLNKTSKGGYADYGTSNWGRRERPLSEKEKEAINTYGLYNLSDFLPKKPGEIEIKVMHEMFEASVDGEPYDQAKWGQYFRPDGMMSQTGDPNNSHDAKKETSNDTNASSVQETSPPVSTSINNDMPSSNGAKDILAMIRARQTQQ